MHLRQKARRQLGGPHRVILVLQRRLTTFCNPSQLNYLAFFPPIISYYILYTNLSFPHTCRRKNATIPSRTYLELKAVSFLDGSPSHICSKSISETTYILKKDFCSPPFHRVQDGRLSHPRRTWREKRLRTRLSRSPLFYPSASVRPSLPYFRDVCSVRSSTRSSRCDASGISLSISSFFCLTFHTVFVRHCKSRIMSFRKAYRDFKIWLKTSYNYVITHVDSPVCTIAGARN